MTPAMYTVIAAAVVIAAFVQGSTGVGFALILAPIVGLLDARLLPVLLLVLMIPLNAYVAWRERHALDTRGAGWITAGRAAGTLAGLWVLITISTRGLNLLIGVSTILAAIATLLVPAFSPGRRAFVVAGALTGITETATGIGGPPLALVLQHQRAPVLRSTVAICFLIGETMSLALLAASGKVHANQLSAAGLLLPTLLLGALLSRLAHRHVDGPLMRTLVLAFAIISGLAVLLNG